MPSPAAPPAGRGLLTTAKVCGTASTNNYMASNATAWAYVWRNFAGFYSAPYANKTLVTGSATGNTFGFQGSTSYAAYDQVLVLFAAVDSSGNHTADTSRYVQSVRSHQRDGRLLARPEHPLGDGAGGQPAGGPLLLLRLLCRRRESPDRLRQLQRRHHEPDHPQGDHPGHLPADLARGRLRDRGAGRRNGRRAPGLLEHRDRPRAGNHPPGCLRPLSRSERGLHRAVGQPQPVSVQPGIDVLSGHGSHQRSHLLLRRARQGQRESGETSPPAPRRRRPPPPGAPPSAATAATPRRRPRRATRGATPRTRTTMRTTRIATIATPGRPPTRTATRTASGSWPSTARPPLPCTTATSSPTPTMRR